MFKRILVIAVVLCTCVLLGCGGASLPTAPGTGPLATMSVIGTKQLEFQWQHFSEVHHYRLLADGDGLSGYAVVPGGTPLFGASHVHELPIHKTDWNNGSFIVQATDEDETIYVSSSELPLTTEMATLATGYFKASNCEANDWFGYAVSISDDGSTMAVGAFGEDSVSIGIQGNESDNSASASGAVYVFTKSGAVWQQQAYIKASNTDDSDVFGIALSLSSDGNTLAVGAFGESSGATGVNGDEADNSTYVAGAVYVYERSGNSWSQEAYIKASNTGPGDLFGGALCLSGDGNTLAVGAQYESSSSTGVNGNELDDSNLAAGAVYLFTRSFSQWSQEAYIKASNSGESDYFGCSVSLSEDGSVLAVGAYGESSATNIIDGDEDDDSAPGAGAVYTFELANGAWAQSAYIKADNCNSGDNFGRVVDLSADGGTLVVGAAWEDGLNDTVNNSGAVYVFNYAASSWSQSACLRSSNPDVADNFALSLALAADGKTIAVGAAGEDSSSIGVGGNEQDNGAENSGAIHVFTLEDELWVEKNYVKAPNCGAGDQFGSSVSLSGDGNTMLVGAYGEKSNARGVGGNQGDDSAEDSGAVYLY